MGGVRAKIGLTGQLDRRQPGNYFKPCMPRHALSARGVEEMWRYRALVDTLISMHGFSSLKCSVTPYFLLIDHFLL